MKTNPFRIILSFLLLLSISSFYAQKQVILDNYFNNEINKKTNLPFHYLWDDKDFSGFSEFGELFKQYGAEIYILKEKPTMFNLKNASVYIIVDPDNKFDAEKPNYMDKKAAKAIACWVKRGGVLLLMTNDSTNCDLEKINILSTKFGIKYNKDLHHPELRGEDKKIRNFPSCASVNLPSHPLFEGVSKIFIKEISSISISKKAKAVLVENNHVFMAETNYGKGYVFAVGDPWLYNEYIDHALLPADFQNKQAAANLVKMLLGK